MALKYISPSALSVWERDRTEFYLTYLAPFPLQRKSQIQAAAIGSAFDARVKSQLGADLFGLDCPDSLQFQPVFESQVSQEHQAWALPASRYALDCYIASGRYRSLLKLLDTADGMPAFEGKPKKVVSGVPVYGMPDLSFMTKGGTRVVLDWKVKGFCSARPISPTKLYVHCADGFVADGVTIKKQNANHGLAHKDCQIKIVDGIPTFDGYLEQSSTTYADQLAIYLWVLGEEPGHSPHIVGIDELVCKPRASAGLLEQPDARQYPLIRVSQLCAPVSAPYQMTLLKRLSDCWSQLQSGHIFEGLSRDESDAKCEQLKRLSITHAGEKDILDAEFARFLRTQFRYG